MSQLTEIIIKAGLVPPNTLAEIRRWAPLLTDPNSQPPTELESEMSVKVLCDSIDEVLQSAGYVIVRETDLTVLPQYLQTMMPGVLHIKLEDDSIQKFSVQVGRLPSGEFVIPWRSDDISELLTDGQTFLRIDKEKYFFSDARELFYGNNKAFIVCKPSTKELDAHRE